MIFTFTPDEVRANQLALLRAKRFTPNLSAADEREIENLLNKFADDTDRRPGDCADDACGDLHTMTGGFAC
jgi:hypothetical protein